MDIARKMNLLSSFVAPEGDSLISWNYTNIIDENGTTMRSADEW